MRNAFAAKLISLALENSRIVLLSGDIGNRLFDEFKKAFPERFYNCGVAEANMVGAAAGLALAGLRPITYTIASFATIRCLEQIRIDVAYHHLPVVVVGTGAGLAYAENGATHVCCDDIACLRTLPGMTLFCPADPLEVDSCLISALKLEGPSYIRLGKKGETRIHSEAPAGDLRLGIWMREKGIVCILTAGTLLPIALQAAEILDSQGIPCAVCSCPIIKPLPVDVLQRAFRRYQLVATLEEHGLIGGFGSSVAEWVVDRGESCGSLVRFGVGEGFVHRAATQKVLRERHGLTPDAIASRLMRRLSEPSKVLNRSD